MFQALQIEWLKSRRTKSYLTAALMFLIGFAWEIVAMGGQVRQVGLAALLSNQTTDTMILPLAVSLFTSRLVRNEQEGQTFRLQQANGHSYRRVFTDKFLLSFLYLAFLCLVKTELFALYAITQGVPILWSALALKLAGGLLSLFVLLCFYLTLAMLMDKQGLLLGAGFLGAFLGIILESKTFSLWSWWIPFTSPAFLSPYSFHYAGEEHGQVLMDFLAMDHLPLRFGLIAILALISFTIVQSLIRKKGGKLS